MAHPMSDEEFARRLRELTGDDGIWADDYTDHNHHASPPDTDPDQSGGALVTNLNDDQDGDDWGYWHQDGSPRGRTMTEEEYIKQLKDEDWQSDDSSEMILNVHHLAIKSKKRTSPGEGPTGSRMFLNKARAALADPLKVPGSSASLSEVRQVEWGSTGLNRGDPSAEEEPFTPWKLIRKYPFSYVGQRSRELCEVFFKAEDICEGQTWDLYYLYHPHEPARKAHLFVPTKQFQHFLDAINAKVNLELTIPEGSNRENFVMHFGEGNTPRPRYLGRSPNYETFAVLSTNVPPLDPDDNLQNSALLAREEFLLRLEMLHKAGKSSKGKSEKNRQKRIENHKAWGRSVKRVQRYLGLRKEIHYPSDGTPIAPPKRLDLDSPMISDMENSVLFVAIDIEAYEFDQNCITEVGIVTLDTSDIKNIAPGEGGMNWFAQIQARHLRILENTWAVNRKHIKGCADRFDFGTSEFVLGADVCQIVEEVIGSQDADGKERTVVLVFHDASQDIGYLEKLGCNVEVYQNILEMVDTRNMHQHIVRGFNPTKLETVLGYLDIPCQNLHNAGNDALYTMRAMVSLAVKKRVASLRNFFGEGKDNEEPSTRTVDEPVPYAELPENGEGWSSGGEETDGGVADKLRGPW